MNVGPELDCFSGGFVNIYHGGHLDLQVRELRSSGLKLGEVVVELLHSRVSVLYSGMELGLERF